MDGRKISHFHREVCKLAASLNIFWVPHQLLLTNLDSGLSWFLGFGWFWGFVGFGCFFKIFFKNIGGGSVRVVWFWVVFFFPPLLLSWFQTRRSPEALPEMMPGMTSFKAFLATGLFVSNSNMQMLF